MSYINFSEANCKNCYKCLRCCPVKAIRFRNNQAEIIEDRCIACGHCLAVCPQNARNIKSDLRYVKGLIEKGAKVAASVAPSFAGFFYDVDEKKIAEALSVLGFSYIEETALGAELVSQEYSSFMEEYKGDSLITTCCPSANFLIEKYYPELIKFMVPVISPMTAHGKLLKTDYGKDCFVVFIGPCVAKKFEAGEVEQPGAVDAVITFDELKGWFEEAGIELSKLKGRAFNRPAYRAGSGFSVSGGILKAVPKLRGGCSNYELLSVSGIEECMEILNSMKKGEIKGVCVELSACNGSCIGGPSMARDRTGFYMRRKKVGEYTAKLPIFEGENRLKTRGDFNFARKFRDKSLERVIAYKAQIEEILHHMGKFEGRDELNCGVCGYNTCRDKAQAIFEGMAETNMCLHYMRTKAESLTNIIFESTPNCVVLVDQRLNVVEFNPAAEDTFMIKADGIKGKPIAMLIDDSDFKKVMESKESIKGKKVSYPQYNVVFIQNIIYLESQNVILITMDNIMAEEKNRRELLRVKENTLNAAQKVIDKQMRVAQEIASLLGETTAETKMTLVNLKKILMGEEGEIK
jgi:iron only hydrogenase large subunit-like protein/uncharacterized Fe-S cluster-containing protein